MPAMFVFLLKVNIALLLFCAGYYLVLRHLTFYTLNRIYLVGAMVFATIYPQINLNSFAQNHEQIAKPVQVVLNWQAPAAVFIAPITKPNYWHWAETVFWLIAAILVLRLAMQLFSLYKLYRGSKPTQIFGHDVRLISGEAGPFSFWRTIYVNPEQHGTDDLRSILMHEQVHVNQWHTADIMLAELATIVYWFNPGIWLMKKAVRENIEFITDRKILNTGLDSRQYQYSLVNVSFAAASPGIVNNFNISTIKKRIIMMNAKRSSKLKLARYAFVLPAVMVLLLIFSFSKAALRKNSAYKALAVHISSLVNEPALHINKTPEKSGAVNNTKRVKANTPKAIAVAPADTIKKGGIKISTPGSADSLNYFINGVKASKSDFDKLDSKNIESIEILSAADAKKFASDADNKHKALFVTTSDSEAGKTFREKLHAANNYTYMIASKTASANAGGGGYTIAAVSPEAKAVRITGRKTASVGYGYSVSPQPAVVGSNVVITTNSAPVIEVGTDSVEVFGATTNKTYVSGNVAYTTSLSKRKIPAHVVYGYNVSASSPKTLYITSDKNAYTNISHLSTKMIMIDGKEATERQLKKLSAADIEDMSVKTGEDVTRDYGDKAKNGVVFITTRKK